ncbi:MAG: S-layer homology domain-containing protein [Tissierellales bacterium]|nr:S-layer homology domain-containing protein [Tissierellales bacterium]MBN2826792.1 S-layer homology domain-containing protein [Tissierellales bacterium]
MSWLLNSNLFLRKSSVFLLVLFLFIGMIPPIPSEAASQFITNISVTDRTSSSFGISFTYSKDTSNEQRQSLSVMLYDENKTYIKSHSFGFDSPVDPRGDYKHVFTNLKSNTQYYVQIRGWAFSGSGMAGVDDVERIYLSDFIGTRTESVFAPQISLESAEIRSFSANLRGRLFSTGTGHVANPVTGSIMSSGEAVMKDYSITVMEKQYDTGGNLPRTLEPNVRFSTGIMPYNIGYTLFDYPNNIPLDPGKTYIAQASATNQHDLTAFSNKLEFTTMIMPNVHNLYVKKGSSNVTVSANIQVDSRDLLTGMIALIDDNDSQDPKNDANAIRGELLSFNPSKGEISFYFKGLSPDTSYDVQIGVSSKGMGTEFIYSTKQTFKTLPPPTIAAVSTIGASFIATDRAKLEGSITFNGNTYLTEQGFVYATLASGNDNPEIDGIGVVKAQVPISTQETPIAFSAYIQNLSPNTGYYYRAYVRNPEGLSYGAVKTFATENAPSATTIKSEDATSNSIKLSGNALTGGLSPTLRGFVVSEVSDPQLGKEGTMFTLDNNTTAKSGLYSSTLTNLIPETTYYFKAFVRNAQGTYYGTQQSFVTLALEGIPSVKLGLSPSQNTPDTKQVSASFSTPPGTTVTATGFIYGTDINPSIANGAEQVMTAAVNGSFSATLSGLSAGTTYYYKAFATNENGTSYTYAGQFTTINQPTTVSKAIVTKTEVESVSATSAVIKTDATVSAGTLQLFTRMLVYSSSNQNPLPGGEGVTSAFAGTLSMTGKGLVTTTLTGLSPDTTYYLRCYTSNPQGLYLGSVVTFVTDTMGLPIVVNPTVPFDSVEDDGAMVYASINPNGSDIIKHGVLVSTYEKIPTLGSQGTLEILGSGRFELPSSKTYRVLGKLQNDQTYYYRVFAQNLLGISYGEVKTFSTLPSANASVSTGNIKPGVGTAEIGMNVREPGQGFEELVSVGILIGSDANLSHDTAPWVLVNPYDIKNKTYLFTATTLGFEKSYYARAFGTNLSGEVFYGDSVAFTTLKPIPVSGTGNGSLLNFKKDSAYTNGFFTDIDESQWYGFNKQKVIAQAYEYGLMKGNSPSTFNPIGNVTLAEAVTMAARVHSIYSTGTATFSQGSPWYQVYVDYAIDNGIIEEDDFDDYNRTATRAEMAYIFSNAMPTSEFEQQNTVVHLPDVNSTTPYYASIMTLYRAGILTGGDTSGTFYPERNISRAEAAAIISRVALSSMRASGKVFE